MLNIRPNRLPICLAIAMAIPLTSCSGFEYQSAVAAYASKCQAEAHAHWLVQPAPLKNLLFISKIENPLTAGGIFPIGPNNDRTQLQYVSRLLGITGANRVDVYIGSIGRGERLLFGANASRGVYAIEVKSLATPECSDPLRAIHLPDFPREGYPVRTDLDQTCLTWSYVGPLDVQAYQYVFANSYDDETAEGPISRDVQTLFCGDGTVYAQSVSYFARYSDAAAGLLCDRPTSVYTLMANTKFGEIQ